MSNIDELERLQELKEKGALSEQEFEVEKAKILNNNREAENKSEKSKNIKKDILFIILVPVIIVFIGVIVNFIFYNTQNNSSPESAKVTSPTEIKPSVTTNTESNSTTENKTNTTNKNNTKKSIVPPTDITEDTTETISINPTTKNSSLIGRHRLIYMSGLSLDGITGYLQLNSDNTFKMYVGYNSINMELINVEGTYSILGNTISINIKREGGFDLGSQSREDTITIAEDNLAYNSIYKFSK